MKVLITGGGGFIGSHLAEGHLKRGDQEWSVEWRAGVPTLSLVTEAFRGQTKEFSFGTAFAFTERGSFGKVYRYKFSTGEIKTPLQDAVTKAGWTWRGVSFGKL